VVISRSSNNYGPNQHPEKFIPLFITGTIEGNPLPLYGDGKNVRNWIYVDDNCSGLDVILHRGKAGESYNVGGNVEVTNINVAKYIIDALCQSKSLIKHVKDRLAHDRRYALASNKLKKLGWKPKYNFREGLARTIAWYANNTDWWMDLKNRAFKKYYKKNYK